MDACNSLLRTFFRTGKKATCPFGFILFYTAAVPFDDICNIIIGHHLEGNPCAKGTI